MPGSGISRRIWLLTFVLLLILLRLWHNCFSGFHRVLFSLIYNLHKKDLHQSILIPRSGLGPRSALLCLHCRLVYQSQASERSYSPRLLHQKWELFTCPCLLTSSQKRTNDSIASCNMENRILLACPYLT